MDFSTITLSTQLSALMSEHQAPSTILLSPISETPSSTPSSAMTSSVPSKRPSTSTTSTSASSSAPTADSVEPSATIAAPHAPTSSDFLSHSTSFYFAVALGSIIGVAILLALIAWAFRKQARDKRRRLTDSAARLPWIYSTGSDDNLFPGTSVTLDIENGMQDTNTEDGVPNLGSRERMAYEQLWERRNGGDVHDPKRLEFDIDKKLRPPYITPQIPSSTASKRYSGQNHLAATPHANRISLGSIDSRLQVETFGRGTPLFITNQVPDDLSISYSQETGFPSPPIGSTTSHPEIGTPRELVPMPRVQLGLDGEALNIPWEEKVLSSNDTPAEKPRSRIISAERIRKTWNTQASEASEDNLIVDTRQGDQKPEGESWITSIRTSLVNVLGVLAGSLPTTAIGEDRNGSDKLTPARPKQSTKRKTLQDSSSTLDEAIMKGTLSRGRIIKSSTSDPWSLAKTGSDIGAVHTRVPVLDTGSLSSHKISDPGLDASRFEPLYRHGRLQVEKETSTSLSSHGLSISSKDSPSRLCISRSLSATSFVSPKRDWKTTQGSMKGSMTSEKRPALNSRTASMITTSSTTSMVSVVTGTEGMDERIALAREALKDRRRKAKRISTG